MLLGLVCLAGLCVGQYRIDPGQCVSILLSSIVPGIERDWSRVSEEVVWYLRMPRILAAALVGASLSMAGACFQGVFQNPLVSPDLLGVSSGSCVGAALAILLGLGAAGIQGFAFAMGVATVALTLLIPRLLKNDTNIMLVLSGIIVGGLMGSVMGFIKYVADPESELATITYWQMGSFAYITPGDLLSILPALAVGFAGLFVLAWQIDLMSLGEREARILGVNVRPIRRLAILCATLLTAGSVCISGTIGWVGLVVPHFARGFVGPNNRVLLPSSACLGAIFLVIVDTCARTITTTELPISVITGLIGAPFYVFLLYKQKTRMDAR
ncbi:FecCD family ABC transporter permease [Curtanaerobium respiraculi]|uniref:FecCD family ABC transporter permease n=1 Tax=Curtanaerobium respiraculi TaxID=2949669 RepID=UPI0024B35E5F|nr:iron ABC transporter permease [Curtanaerobium respiraculi]